MCLARVQFVDQEKQGAPAAIDDVAVIRRIPDGLEVTDLLGVVTNLEGEIQRIDFMESIVQVGKPGTVGDSGR